MVFGCVFRGFRIEKVKLMKGLSVSVLKIVHFGQISEKEMSELRMSEMFLAFKKNIVEVPAFEKLKTWFIQHQISKLCFYTQELLEPKLIHFCFVAFRTIFLWLQGQNDCPFV